MSSSDRQDGQKQIVFLFLLGLNECVFAYHMSVFPCLVMYVLAYLVFFCSHTFVFVTIVFESYISHINQCACLCVNVYMCPFVLFLLFVSIALSSFLCLFLFPFLWLCLHVYLFLSFLLSTSLSPSHSLSLLSLSSPPPPPLFLPFHVSSGNCVLIKTLLRYKRPTGVEGEGLEVLQTCALETWGKMVTVSVTSTGCAMHVALTPDFYSYFRHTCRKYCSCSTG